MPIVLREYGYVRVFLVDFCELFCLLLRKSEAKYIFSFLFNLSEHTGSNLGSPTSRSALWRKPKRVAEGLWRRDALPIAYAHASVHALLWPWPTR